jgi:GNAT superfamily N-acetyltransferase
MMNFIDPSISFPAYNLLRHRAATMSPQPTHNLFADLALARRLERAEGLSCAEFVEARARSAPETGACWTDVEGTYAMFDTPDSPITQTFGLGMFQAASAAGLDAIESFFRRRGAPVVHEVSPLAGIDLARMLAGRGYQPAEFTSVMFRPLDQPLRRDRDTRVNVRLVTPADAELYANTAAQGWSEATEYAPFIYELALVGAARSSALSFLAELDGVPVATGGMTVTAGVALLSGASTIPEHRKQGAQFALLEARLRTAAEQGCDLAMMCAAPGSASQRNAERHGFRIAYTRTKWQL